MCYLGFKRCGKVTSAEWLPYLTINVHDKFSTTTELRCGVPQGSILEPFYYILPICHRP